jgi:hypothetical protein
VLHRPPIERFLERPFRVEEFASTLFSHSPGSELRIFLGGTPVYK